ncbi:4Fe-4S binding protein [Geothermobacter ehrlichii]|uniref:4Fe-4S binding protein n=1 Tax=Geothermobacter ehrlichii TaxID=213224 RepID=A0A5D3WKW4_9BACT|nr:4Fe-4S dicluster domain-containing protein [Geothermobacter ehrlichii]TYO97477.1 4Fe-4S binding protein [Geothermobacter ehrlichii]
MRIVIHADRCQGSGECIRVCPEKAISMVDGKAVLDESRCNFDGICIPACPHGAIEFDEGELGGCGF